VSTTQCVLNCLVFLIYNYKLFHDHFFLKRAAVLISGMGQIRVLLELLSSEMVKKFC